jgi:spore coat polysaccharide biosynthesis protein SpsF
MGSTRFPGKMLADVNGKSAMTRLMDRLQQCTLVDEIILATSVSPVDDPLDDWAKREGVAIYRGSEDDVLLRVIEAQRSTRADIVVEITGDCTLTDPDIVDVAVATYLENECDFVTNCEKNYYPPGMYAQVFSLAALEAIGQKVKDPAVREHVSLYFYEHPDEYRIIHLMSPPRWKLPDDCRIYLDYREDLEFIKAIYSRLEPEYGDQFRSEEIVALLKAEPELMNINRFCRNVPVR